MPHKKENWVLRARYICGLVSLVGVVPARSREVTNGTTARLNITRLAAPVQELVCYYFHPAVPLYQQLTPNVFLMDAPHGQ